MERVCENCAQEDDDLAFVNRVYPAADDRPETRVPDAELWCFSCRSLYPHEPVEAD